MNIILKESKTGWVKVSDEISILVDYLTIEQESKLKQILYEVGFMPDLDLNNTDSLNPENKAKLMTLNEKYYKLFIKYTIKDWQGVRNSNGQDVEFRLVKNEMDSGLWESLCRSLTVTNLYELVSIIKKEIEFTEADKKK